VYGYVYGCVWVCVWVMCMDTGSRSSARPGSINIGAYLSLGPVSILIGTYSLLEARFYHHWVLLLHEARFYHHWVLLLHEARLNDSPNFFQFFLTKNGKICPSMQCQTNFSSFLKIEKFCPSVGQRRLMQSSGFLSPLSLCQATTARRESVYFFRNFSKSF
jgi:hypothetical protein